MVGLSWGHLSVLEVLSVPTRWSTRHTSQRIPWHDGMLDGPLHLPKLQKYLHIISISKLNPCLQKVLAGVIVNLIYSGTISLEQWWADEYIHRTVYDMESIQRNSNVNPIQAGIPIRWEKRKETLVTWGSPTVGE